MIYKIPYDYFRNVLYIPKGVDVGPNYLKTGQVYPCNQYNSEVLKHFYLANRETAKRILLTSQTSPYPWMCKVISGDAKVWNYFAQPNNNGYYDVSPSNPNKNIATFCVEFSFSDNDRYFVQQCEIIFNRAHEKPDRTIIEGKRPLESAWTEIMCLEYPNLKGIAYPMKCPYGTGFEYIRVRAATWHRNVNALIYLDVSPDLGYFYVPKAPEMENFESYVCITHTNLSSKWVITA